MTMASTMREVAADHGYESAQLCNPRFARDRRWTLARWHFMWRCCTAGYTLHQVGRFLGGVDHTTVLRGARRFAAGATPYRNQNGYRPVAGHNGGPPLKARA